MKHPMSEPWLDWKPMRAAPKDGTVILATMEGERDVYYVLFWNGSFFESLESGEGPEISYLTHWTNIPRPTP